VQDPAPAREYWPAGQAVAVALVDPAGQAYPAVQLPVQDGVVRPVVEPKVPAGQGDVHAATPTPAEDPYLPAAQEVHVPAAARLYVPGGQMDAVALVDPAGQAYPARQLPLQAAVAKPGLDP